MIHKLKQQYRIIIKKADYTNYSLANLSLTDQVKRKVTTNINISIKMQC